MYHADDRCEAVASVTYAQSNLFDSGWRGRHDVVFRAPPWLVVVKFLRQGTQQVRLCKLENMLGAAD